MNIGGSEFANVFSEERIGGNFFSLAIHGIRVFREAAFPEFLQKPEFDSGGLHTLGLQPNVALALSNVIR